MGHDCDFNIPKDRDADKLSPLWIYTLAVSQHET